MHFIDLPVLVPYFLQLCAGAIRSKNTMNILLQTILDACVSALAFYILGWVDGWVDWMGWDGGGSACRDL